MRSQAAADGSHELMSPRDEQRAVAVVAAPGDPSLHFSCTAVKSCPQCTALHKCTHLAEGGQLLSCRYTLLLSTVPKLEARGWCVLELQM